MALKGRDVPEIGFKRKCTPSVSCGVRYSGVRCQVSGRSGGHGEAFHFSVLLTYKGRAPILNTTHHTTLRRTLVWS